MNNIFYPFLLTFISGGATLLGFLLIFTKKINKYNLNYFLSFASGVMFFVSILDLIPESLKLISLFYDKYMVLSLSFLSIILGISLSFFLSNFLSKNKKINSLTSLGFISFLAIIIHNIPEGIITYIKTSKSIFSGLPLFLAILIHNIPEGMTISLPMYYGNNNKKKAFFYTLTASLSEPLGAFLTFLFLKNYINDLILGLLFSITAGIMLYISLCELLKEALRNSSLLRNLIYFGLGIIPILITFIN